MVLAYLTLGIAVGLVAFVAAVAMGIGLLSALALFSSTATLATLVSVVRHAQCLGRCPH